MPDCEGSALCKRHSPYGVFVEGTATLLSPHKSWLAPVVLGARPQNAGVSYVDHYILGLLPDPEGGLCDILPCQGQAAACRPAHLHPNRAVNQRLARPAQNHLRPHPRPVGQVPVQAGPPPASSLSPTVPALGAPAYWQVRIKTAVPRVPQANHPYPSKS
jgi:hypothetical protein